MKQLKGHESWRVPFLFAIIRHFLSYLPNITATAIPQGGRNDTLQAGFSGALYPLSSGSKGATSVDADIGVIYGFGFDASRSSTLYGSSDTVQPNSTRILFVIKY